MKKLILLLPMLLFLVAVIPANAATCTPTGFHRDGSDLTAALINPKNVTGNVNATGCNIGVYYGPGKSGKISNANIYGANYYGVVNQKGNVEIANSKVHDIGETPLNGSQHGVGIYFATIAGIDNGDCSTGSTTGKVSNTTVYKYQKGGIAINCKGASATINNNTIKGEGHIGYIAQNGIQIGYGAVGRISNNNVSGNSYTGSSTNSTGILLVGGPYWNNFGATWCGSTPCQYSVGTEVTNNILTNNDVGIYFSNLDSSGNPPSTRTNNKATNNIISSDGLYNGYPYQAGITDEGNGDTLKNNVISGNGYSSSAHPNQAYGIDTSYATNAHLVNNIATN